MLPSRLALFALFALFAFSALAQAQIYSWRDGEGKMHYSDQPPPVGVDRARTLKPQLAPAADGEQAKKKLTEQEIDFRKRQADAAEAAAKAQSAQAETADRQRNCSQARSYLQTLESGMRVTRSDDKGERAFLDDQERAQEIAAAKRAIAGNCN